METIESVKTFWNKRPCNIRHSTKEIGTKEYFDEVERRKYFVEPHIIDFAEFEKWKGKKVLEIGCGIGTDTINFARAGAILTSVDISEESLKIAKQRASLFGLENIKFYQANAEELSKYVPIETYDLVYSFGVIHHTPNPENVMDEIKKYIGKDSELRIMMYHKYSYKVFWILLKYGYQTFWNIEKIVAKYAEAQIGCPVAYIYSRKTIAELLKDYKITDINIDHIFPYKIKDYVKYTYNKAWYFKWIPQRIFRNLEKKFGWHMLIYAKIK